MYYFLLRIQFTSSTRINPSQLFALWLLDALQILSTYLLISAVKLFWTMLDDVVRRTQRLTCTYCWDPFSITEEHVDIPGNLGAG